MHSEADSPLLLQQCPRMKCKSQISRNFCAVISECNRRSASLWLLIWIGRAVQGCVQFINLFFGQTGTPCGLDTNLPCRVLVSCRNDRLCVQLKYQPDGQPPCRLRWRRGDRQPESAHAGLHPASCRRHLCKRIHFRTSTCTLLIGSGSTNFNGPY
jgi:hypothetical protein